MRHLRGLVIAACLLLLLGPLGCGHLATSERARATDVVNTIGMSLIMVPAGEFLMGGTETAEALVAAYPNSGKAPDYFADEYPRHRVRITRGFFLGRFEVTVA